MIKDWYEEYSTLLGVYTQLLCAYNRVERENTVLRRQNGMDDVELDAMLIDMEQRSNSEMEVLEVAAVQISE